MTVLTTTTENLPDFKLSIQQPKHGYRYNLEPFILADFIDLEKGESVLDLGTGVGIIPLLLARQFPAVGKCTGIEIQPELAEIARRNVKINSLQQQITIIQGDYRLHRQLAPPSSFSTVIANPPYYPQQQGRLNNCRQKAIARHEITTDLDSLVDAAAFFIKPGGRFVASYPAERLPTLINACQRRKLTPKYLQCVHSQPSEPAELILLAARQNGNKGLQITAPRYLHP
jgi:tRNA1Val (adenine37-N6)-methyltransferase